ncbi:inner membrane protein [Escherichia coli]|nr:inner membrane protein [Escherichia coli]
MARMMNAFFLSQLLACISFVLDISAFHFRRRAMTLVLLTSSTSLLAIHFYLLHQPAAAGLMLIAACRYAITIVTQRRWAMWGFMIGSLLCSAYLWQGMWGLLPLAGSLLMTYASFQTQGGKLRGYTLCGSLCWLLNNAIVGSPVAVMMELAFSGSIVAAWWRYSATRRSGCV